MIRIIRALCLALVIASQYVGAAEERPAEWAQPLAVAGVPNLHQIGPGIYRSAQPTAAGMHELAVMGIRTVINLRNYHDDGDALAGTDLHAIRIPINTWDIRDAHVVKALRALKRPADGPFLIHCQHGADRTGLMSAMYRIVIEGWGKERAIAEMTQGGYGYHVVWKNILRYIRHADIDKIRRQVDA